MNQASSAPAVTGAFSFLSQALRRHLQQMLDAIFVSTFQRLHRAEEGKNFFNGVEGGFLIRLWHGDLSPC